MKNENPLQMDLFAQAEKKTAWETLVKWANEETAKSSKHRASYVQMELF